MASPAFRPRLLDSLKHYNSQLLRADLMAGVTVGIVALPLAMAFAIASGVTPQAGICTAVIAGLLAAALGGTRLCVTGPTGAFIVILYGIVSKYGVANLLVCTFMAGAMLVLMGVFRLGQVIRFFPMPLITGFTNGIAVLIFLTQMKDFFGLPIARMPSGFFNVVLALRGHFSALHWPTTLLSAALLALILAWPKRLNRILPSPFAALVLATAATAAFGLPVATLGSRFGGIPQGLPAFAGLDLSPAHLSDLMAPAFTIALLGAIESLLCAVVVDSLTADRHDANQELIGQGIANMVVPFFGGIPATGAVVRSVTNIGNGARTPLAAIFHALLLLAVLLLAAPLAAHVPLAALAAILVAVALKMGDWDIRKAWRFPRHDTAVLILTFVLTVIFDLTVAVEIGLLLAAVFFIRSMASHTSIKQLKPEYAQLFERHTIAGKVVPDGCAAFRVEGALFFGAADAVDVVLKQAPHERVVILQLHRLVLLDASGLLALDALRERLAEQGKTLILCGAADEVMDMLVGSRLAERLGADNLQPDLVCALARAEQALTDGVVWG
ncbi:SulP family inorganic anion transporter [Chromobacterium subtsugae]|uniref:SulP family inorganic anion transporter n=1 Tax=Chromobacterium subtsugae TaxID=251747 RepID=UPI00064171D5|nr:SulP family inorganic anion transporter [Chromobacterium subtsugae]